MPTSYVTRRSIPVLDEHTFIDRDDNGQVQKVVVDEAKLRKIAENNNRRIRETGDYCPLVIGHTVDGLPEDKQPEIVGYAGNFRVLPFKRTGRKAIYADFYYDKRHYNKAKKFPRRSVELWHNRNELDPIALLGATSPERDLGLIKFKRSKDKPLRYSRVMNDTDNKANKSNDPADEIVNKVVAALKESDVWKWAESQMAAQETPDGMEDDMGDLGDEDLDELIGDEDMGDLGDEDMVDEDMVDEDEDDIADPDAEEEPVRLQSAAPSGSNVSPEEFPKRKMSRRGDVSRYARENQALLIANHDLKIKLQRETRRSVLSELANQGFMLNVDEELDDVAALDDPSFNRYIARVKKNYQRAPHAPVDAVRASTPARYARNGETSSSQDATKRIIEFATKNGLTYAEALEKMQGQRTF